jgi:deazaflavin-dependent oxidoreductase (nitroreductase family)
MTATFRRAGEAAVRTGFRVLNQLVTPPLRSGLASPLPGGPGLVLLETTGRTSGAPREVPLVAARVGDRLVVSTVRSDSQWLQNLEAAPAGRVWTCGRPQAVTAVVRRGVLNTAVLTPSP